MYQEKLVELTPKEVHDVLIKPPDEELKGMLRAWMREGRITGNFGYWTVAERLQLLQRTPEDLIKIKPGKNSAKYVQYKYAKAALNFAFNFDIKTEIKEIKCTPGPKSANGNSSQEAYVHMAFTFGDDRYGRRHHEVVATAKMFGADCSYDVIKSAISKAWTIVARNFGIGDDLDSDFSDFEGLEDRPRTQDVPPAQAPGNLPY